MTDTATRDPAWLIDVLAAHVRWLDDDGPAGRCFDLSGVDLSGVDLRGVTLPLGVPIVPNLDASILDAMDAGGSLDMATWHSCDTTHCRGGWAIVLAGEAGAALEDTFDSGVAAALIYAASCPEWPVPDFYATNTAALADMCRRAGRA